MDALYNEQGAVYAWLHANGNVYGLEGQALAWVEDDGVYDWEGVHIAWWANGHVRDWLGAVCLFTAKATQTLVVKPVCELHRHKPLKLAAPQRPLRWPKLAKPPNLCIWTKKIPF